MRLCAGALKVEGARQGSSMRKEASVATWQAASTMTTQPVWSTGIQDSIEMALYKDESNLGRENQHMQQPPSTLKGP